MAYADHSKKKVCYYYDPEIENSFYGEKHPMKPIRIAMAHDLIVNYGLYKKLHVYRPYRATAADFKHFHSDDYITFLQRINVNNMNNDMKSLMKRFDIGTHSRMDCPVFDGMFMLCQISSGGSISAANKINRGEADICINFAGGLHHAKKAEASGFCYVNDIVLCILELLKYHPRVLYVDIDCHHGDGVEEAFYVTNRVMTLSFHQFGDDFFPGTGNVSDIGAGRGKFYSVNVPFKSGIDDDDYEKVFTPVMAKVMQVFAPSVIVLQCGADSLTNDKLGDFNLTLKGHGKCVEYIRSLNVPLVMLGGGGYTIRNVSRCWTYETAIALGTELSDDLPLCTYYNYFQPDYKLHINPNMTLVNQNNSRNLHSTVMKVFENLSNLTPVPSVQIQDIPHPFIKEEEDNEENGNASDAQLLRI